MVLCAAANSSACFCAEVAYAGDRFEHRGHAGDRLVDRFDVLGGQPRHDATTLDRNREQILLDLGGLLEPLHDELGALLPGGDQFAILLHGRVERLPSELGELLDFRADSLGVLGDEGVDLCPGRRAPLDLCVALMLCSSCQFVIGCCALCCSAAIMLRAVRRVKRRPAAARLRLKSMGPQTIVIKKYENRRLYDSTHSRYVNLDEVAQMVRDGRDVQVVDAVTGEDRTRAVLTQIVVEHAKDDHSAFPLDVLRQMVVASGRVTNEAALTYMRGVFDMYQNAYRAVAPVAPPHVAAPAPPPASSAVPHRGDVEVDALKKRLEELESVVSGIRSKPARRGSRGGRSAADQK